MDPSLLSIANIEEVRENLSIKGYTLNKGKGPDVSFPQEYKGLCKRGFRKNLQNKKVFQNFEVRLSNLTPTLFNFKLYKKPALLLKKRVLIPTLVLKMCIWESPEVLTCVNRMYLIKGVKVYSLYCTFSKCERYAHVDISEEGCRKYFCKHRVPIKHTVFDYGLI